MEKRRRHPPRDSSTLAAAQRAAGTVRAGLILNDRYEILKYLRGGSASEIYVARHVTLQNHVAVKIMREPLVGRRDLLQRMILEAQALANLRDPNLVRTFDAGSIDGRFYIVMDLLEGLDLRDLLNQQGPQSLLRALYIVRDAASGLLAAHSMGAIHRDIKPENIILTNRDEVVVIDLGVMKIHSAIVGVMHRHITDDARVPGTIAYMCPVQLARGIVDARTDTFALCIVFYELLTTCHPQWTVPFELPPEEELRRLMLRWAPPRPIAELRPDLPPIVQTILDKGLAADPADRFQSMHELLDTFEEVYDLHQAALDREESCPPETTSTLAETEPGLPARLRLARQAKGAASPPPPSTECPTVPGIPSRLSIGKTDRSRAPAEPSPAAGALPATGTRISFSKSAGPNAKGESTTPRPSPAATKASDAAIPKTPAAPTPPNATPVRPSPKTSPPAASLPWPSSSRVDITPSHSVGAAAAVSLDCYASRRDGYLASIPAHVPPDPTLLDPEVEKVQVSPSLYVPTIAVHQPEKSEPRVKQQVSSIDSVTPAPSSSSKATPTRVQSRAALAAMSAAIGIAIGAVTFGTALRPRPRPEATLRAAVQRRVELPSPSGAAVATPRADATEVVQPPAAPDSASPSAPALVTVASPLESAALADSEPMPLTIWAGLPGLAPGDVLAPAVSSPALVASSQVPAGELPAGAPEVGSAVAERIAQAYQGALATGSESPSASTSAPTSPAPASSTRKPQLRRPKPRPWNGLVDGMASAPPTKRAPSAASSASLPSIIKEAEMFRRTF